MSKSEPEKISRRNFVQKATLGAAGLAAAPALQGQTPQSGPFEIPAQWDLEAGVVGVGSGAPGLPACIRGRDGGASVIVVEANYEIGGHGILNGGQVPLGGGTSHQKKHGVHDTPDMVFKDFTDWSVLETNGMPDYRFNDRAVQRALADNEASAYEFLLENGVVFSDEPLGVAGVTPWDSPPHVCIMQSGIRARAGRVRAAAAARPSIARWRIARKQKV